MSNNTDFIQHKLLELEQRIWELEQNQAAIQHLFSHNTDVVPASGFTPEEYASKLIDKYDDQYLIAVAQELIARLYPMQET